MIEALARCLMRVAIRCLGDRRRDWGFAMQGEFEVAIDDGKPLSFALGCLLGAWREMPAHAEGRFVLANYTLALGLVLPIAALLIAGAIIGFPYLDFGQNDIVGILTLDGAPTTLLNDGNRAAASSLSLVVILLAGTSVLVAWAMLDREWERVGAIERFTAAATLTLIVFVGLLGFDETRMALPIIGLVVQHIAILLLAHWHWRLCRNGSIIDHTADV
ncbi:hypothetical protein [Sphingomonas sp. M1A8_2b]